MKIHNSGKCSGFNSMGDGLPAPTWTARWWNSSILKVGHTKGTFPIKILIKFNPSSQSSVTNCVASAGLIGLQFPDSSCGAVMKSCSVDSGTVLWLKKTTVTVFYLTASLLLTFCVLIQVKEMTVDRGNAASWAVFK